LQTLETTRRLGEVDRELIKSALDSLFARRAVGDIEGLLQLLAPEVVCFDQPTWGCARFPCRIVGRDAMREMLRQRHINYVWVGMQVHRILIDSDSAAVHRTTTLRERGSGVTHTYDSVSFFRFRDGLIVEVSELADGSARDVINNFPH
jgi:uncharacterized protein